jgi:hypothetical protein
MAMTVDGPSERTAIAHWGFSRLGFYQLQIPYYIPSSDYSYLSDLIFDCPLSLHEGSLFREVKLYTGGVMRELVKCLTFGEDPKEEQAQQQLQQQLKTNIRIPRVITGVEVVTRLEAFRSENIERTVQKLQGIISKLDRVQRVALLLVIFRMILHLPADAATSSVNLPQEIRSLFLPSVVQKFYHPRDSVAYCLHIPTAVNMCVHLAFCGSLILNKLAEKPFQVMDKLVASIMDSRTVCSESKRRLIRFYAHHRLTLGDRIKVSGLTDFDKPMEVDTGKVFVCHHFAGLTPAKDIVAWLLAQAILASDPSSVSSYSDIGKAVPIVFIPGRTDYCFFDYFVFNTTLKRFFAVSTAATPSDWQKSASVKSSTGMAQQQQRSRDTLITPSSLMEMWSRVLGDVLPVKFTTHCVSVKATDLLVAANCPWQPAIAEPSSPQ